MRLVIAARKSDLARLQAYQVGAALEEAHPQVQVQFHFRESLGDLNQVNPLWQMPEKGVFTEDFVSGLESGEFDMVVHSWKDLPTEVRSKTFVAATMKRADSRDVLLVRKAAFNESRSLFRVLSSSPRRSYFLQKAWTRLAPKGTPGLEFHSVRGNIPTRLLKLHEGQGEALLVAKAALDRLLSSEQLEFLEARQGLRKVLNDCNFMVIPWQIQPPAPAQGALAIEIRKDRNDVHQLLQAIHCPDTFAAAQWERSQLAAFGGGCHLKLGALQMKTQGQTIQIVMGAPPQDEPVEKMWLEKSSMKSLLKALVDQHHLAAFRTEEFFDVQESSSPSSATAFFVSHKRAWSERFREQAQLIWTSGLATWETLAEKGVWVNGSAEGWGESRPNVDELAGQKVSWAKLSHDLAPEDAISKVTTYRLVPRTTLEPATFAKLKTATHFFWHSGTLFDSAVNWAPEIKHKHHSSGLGATRAHLASTLGEPGNDQIFLGEHDWRSFYELK
ncbi:MAG: hydroxymethylbilane synthase [Bdellovibrio sp.]